MSILVVLQIIDANTLILEIKFCFFFRSFLSHRYNSWFQSICVDRINFTGSHKNLLWWNHSNRVNNTCFSIHTLFDIIYFSSFSLLLTMISAILVFIFPMIIIIMHSLFNFNCRCYLLEWLYGEKKCTFSFIAK